jgi:hypothetical protein
MTPRSSVRRQMVGSPGPRCLQALGLLPGAGEAVKKIDSFSTIRSPRSPGSRLTKRSAHVRTHREPVFRCADSECAPGSPSGSVLLGAGAERLQRQLREAGPHRAGGDGRRRASAIANYIEFILGAMIHAALHSPRPGRGLVLGPLSRRSRVIYVCPCLPSSSSSGSSW